MCASTTAEVRYLCDTVNRYFARKVAPAEVVWSYCGVRPLLDDKAGDPSSVTRDYKLEMEREDAPLLSVFGGKITTYRRLAETAVDKLAPLLGNRAPAWTAQALLPGGGPAAAAAPRAFLRSVERRYPWLPRALRTRYCARLRHAHRTRHRRSRGRSTISARKCCPGCYAREIDYLQREEWARTAEDILWRRSKLGLHLPADAADVALARCVAAHGGTDMARYILALDQGTTSSRSILFDHGGNAVAMRAAGVPAALSAVRLGRARSARDLDAARRQTIAEVLASARRVSPTISRPSASPISARRRCCGIARPASRSHAPSSGRTGARPSTASV